MKPELIETMCADLHGQIELWELHMERLRRSANALGYVMPTTDSMAIDVAQHLLQARQSQITPTQDWRVRLLLNEQGALSITVAVLTPLHTPQKVALAATTLNSQQRWLQHKSTHRPWYTRATAWLAEHPDYFDVLFLNERGEVCEGSRSNVYLHHHGQWLTPRLTAGLLAGVQRTHLLQQGLAQEDVLLRDQLHAQTKLRLSNGLRGWFDVQLDTQTRID